MPLDDPSLMNNYIQIHQAEILFTISTSDKMINFADTLMVRMFKNNNSYKIELTSENNINFLYKLIIKQGHNNEHSNEIQSLESVQKSNKIEFDTMEGFGLWIKNLFTFRQQQKWVLTYQFEVTNKKEGVLSIHRKQKYKEYSLGSLLFVSATLQQLNQNLMYRYQKMLLRKSMLQKYQNDMMNIIRTKNPTMYLDLKKKKKKNTPAFK